jgi:hypothetical protein
MGIAKRWREAWTAKVVAECGTGKTLISLGAVHVHSDGRPYRGVLQPEIDSAVALSLAKKQALCRAYEWEGTVIIANKVRKSSFAAQRSRIRGGGQPVQTLEKKASIIASPV